jgi:biotin carboxyl carrier protein
MKITFDNTTIDLTPTGKSYRAMVGDKIAEVKILHAEGGKLDLLIDGERITACVSSDHAKRWVTIHGRTFVLTKQSGSRRSAGSHHHAAGELTAPMPGQVRAVNVNEGDEVIKGQTLMVLEAMKMEIRIQSPSDGVISSISVKVGETVEREQTLIIVESHTSKV